MAHTNELAGVFAAVLTPLNRDLRPDHRRLIDHCRHLLQTGCDGLAPLGTTGEANSIAIADRIALIEALAAAELPMRRMIVGVGTPALHDTVSLCRAALEAGAAGLLALPPFYYKNQSEDGLFAAYAGLADRIGDLGPRIYLYHFPQLSAAPITLALITRLRKAYPGVFVGMKDSSGDFANTLAMIKGAPGLAVFSGSEELLLDNLRAGGVGCISATANVTQHLAQAVARAFAKGGGDGEQSAATLARKIISQFPAIPALKAIKAAQTGDDAWLAMLPPMQPLSRAQISELFASLVNVDGFENLRSASEPAAG